MERKMKLGDYLVVYLKKIGVSHLCGIPEDLVINLFLKFGRPKGLKIITLSHEPGVGFAADGYARSTGEHRCHMRHLRRRPAQYGQSGCRLLF
jgi:thiamine pyrophosphate-dependent acetolactate synthase large subunit-like protein